MPELPEVEVAARNLRRWTSGRRVRAVRPGDKATRIFRPAGPRALQALAGGRFVDVGRRGKNLLITLEAARGGPRMARGASGAGGAGDKRIGLWSHLGLTGKWLHRPRDAEPEPRSTRLAIDLDDGSHLYYVDARMFGRARVVAGARFDELPEVKALGPDPLIDGIDAAALHARLSRSRLPIKVAIMDQRLLPGVGNIQASEALFRAGIDPRRPSRSLSKDEVARLGGAILESIAYTLSTFAEAGVDGGGADIVYVEEQRTSNPFLVYGRAGQPCPKSARGRGRGHQIVRIVQAQRATFFCPRCQR